jgi:hypothetical protein
VGYLCGGAKTRQIRIVLIFGARCHGFGLPVFARVVRHIGQLGSSFKRQLAFLFS